MHSSAASPPLETVPSWAARPPHVGGAVLVLCRDGIVEWASDGLPELLGYADGTQLFGRSLIELLADRAFDTDEVSSISSKKSNAHQSNVVRVADPDEDTGRYLGVTRIHGSEGPILADREIWLLSEITTSAASEILASARAEVENARKEFSQGRDELIALLSHELRTPLTVISGYSKLLLSGRSGALTSEQQRYLEESRKSCDRLDRFVTDLLDASHDHAASFRVSLEDASVEEVIRGVIEFFLPLFEERDIVVEVEIKGVLPAARFDPGRIEQVLTNLIGNAVKYTKVGGVISIRACPFVRNDESRIEVSVTDDGPGIAPEDITRIFEPYVRSARDHRGAGIGLGLAICRRILEAHGGDIGVEMVADRGSRFVFSIPASADAERAGC